MVHLTMVGQYAGTMYCDKDKYECASKGDEFYHYAYCDDRLIEQWRKDNKLCPDCDQFIQELNASRNAFETKALW